MRHPSREIFLPVMCMARSTMVGFLFREVFALRCNGEEVDELIFQLHAGKHSPYIHPVYKLQCISVHSVLTEVGVVEAAVWLGLLHASASFDHEIRLLLELLTRNEK